MTYFTRTGMNRPYGLVTPTGSIMFFKTAIERTAYVRTLLD